MMIRAEINKIEAKKKNRKDQWNKELGYKRINKINKPLARLKRNRGDLNK
jgi:hypothetical protein